MRVAVCTGLREARITAIECANRSHVVGGDGVCYIRDTQEPLALWNETLASLSNISTTPAEAEYFELVHCRHMTLCCAVFLVHTDGLHFHILIHFCVGLFGCVYFESLLGSEN